MLNPKEDKIQISISTCLSWFIISMLKYFIGEDLENRKVLAEALEDVVIDFWGEVKENGMFSYALDLLIDESLTSEDVLRKMEEDEVVIDDDYLVGKELDMMIYAFYKLGLNKDWLIVVEPDFFKPRYHTYLEEGEVSAMLYALRKSAFNIERKGE